MALVNREQVKGATLRTVMVPAPECGEDAEILVSDLDGLSLIRLREKMYPIGEDGRAYPDREKMPALRVIACARNADGTPMYGDDDLAEVQALPGALLMRLSEAAARLTGEYGVEERAKNS
ncbi:MAG TPA: hypothetical protein PLP01_10870 [Phycisphaerae bacterium]|nr:hypothetical protein [Phycisphaerae bacterium]HOI55741.1 hypothetical protein [Phycisphaerae bacterium]